MKNNQLKKDLYSVGVKDFRLGQFDVTFFAKHGTSYNAFLIKGSEKNTVIDGVKMGFTDEYIRNINDVMPVSKIDYVIVQHTEPDHSSSLKTLVAMNPEITVLGSLMAVTMLKDLLNMPFKSRVVKDGETISLGDKTLTFYVLPNVHWPDTMCTYCPQLKTVFTCDFFGAHYASDETYVSEIKDRADYETERKFYFDCIMLPFPNFVTAALNRLEPLDISLIATSHGPLIDENIESYFSSNRIWGSPRPFVSPALIVIVYASAYGFTKMISTRIKDKLLSSGFQVEEYDLSKENKDKIIERVRHAKGLLVGSTTMTGDAVPPVYEFLAHMIPAVHGFISASAFGSYGWSGEAVGNIIVRLKQLRFKVNDEGLRIRFYPDENKLLQAEEFAAQFAKSVI